MAEQIFEVNKIYINDISAEAPNSPQIHKKQWDPEINLNLGNDMQTIDEEEGLYNVSLKITATAKIKDDIAYIIEVQQSGIFTIKHFEKEQRAFLIGAAVPNILFPYIREAISSLSQKLGFTPLLLNPIDFNALYQQSIQQQQAEQQASTETKH